MQSDLLVTLTDTELLREAGARVVIAGVDAPGGLMHSFANAFGRQGAAVRTWCYVRGAYASPFGALATRALWRLAPSVMSRRANARMAEALRDATSDLVVVLKGQFVLPETVDTIRRATGAVVVNYYPDDPFEADASMGLTGGPSVLRAYDRCYTFAQHLVEEYRRHGVTDVEWMPFARDIDQHSFVPAIEPPEFDAVFVGNLDSERVRWLEAVAARHRVGIFGEHTLAAVPAASPLRRATFLPAAYEAELGKALARGAVSLNVMRLQNRFSHNMRSYESLACGAFTISQWTPELERMFRDGEEVVFAKSPEEMAALVGAWLPRRERRRAVAAAGFARVADDTYDARARTMLDYVGASGVSRR